MGNTIEAYTLPGKRRLSIIVDINPQNPWTEYDGNIANIYSWHTRYEIYDNGNRLAKPDDAEEYAVMVCEAVKDHLDPGMEKGRLCEMLDWYYAYQNDGEYEKAARKIKQAIRYAESKAIVMPLYMYDHGGVIISTGAFSDPWDSGQVGFIVTGRAEFSRACGKVTRWTKKQIERAEAFISAEIDTFSQYINGDVYGFVIEDEDGNEEDSCWGFYGYDIVDNGIFGNLSDRDKKYLRRTKQVSVPRMKRW